MIIYKIGMVGFFFVFVFVVVAKKYWSYFALVFRCVRGHLHTRPNKEILVYSWLHKDPTEPYITGFLYFGSHHISTVPLFLSGGKGTM